MAHRHRFAQIPLVLLIAVVLCVPSVWGAPRRLSPELNPSGAIARLWEFLVAIWSQSGCMADPHGNCATANREEPPAPPTTDSGCMLDPHGGCTPGS